MHDGQAIGICSVRGSDNLFLNCDAYRNHDFTSEDGNGDLPAIRFMHPSERNLLTDKGVDVGLPFRGAAPDLGAFEE
jgi:hypothetical protein